MFVKWRKIFFDRTFHHKGTKFPNSVIDWFSNVTQLSNGAMVCQEGYKVKWYRRTGRQSAGVTKMGEKDNCIKQAKIDFLPSPSFEL